MGNEYIYVSLCCLGEDQELEHTVRSCFQNAKNADNIYIGIAFIGDEHFYEETKNKLKDFTNIRYSYTTFENNLGSGNGRVLAQNLYSDENYFFQVDAHTRFSPGWDEYLIKTFIKSQKIVNNQKVVLTRLPGIYEYVHHNNNSPYPINLIDTDGQIYWKHNEFMLNKDKLIPVWDMISIKQCPEHIKTHILNTGISPISKTSGAFIFGNYHLANNLCVSKESIFWEEETLQATELVANGFTLVYPGTKNIIYHLYSQNIKNGKGKRTSLSLELFSEKIKNNFLEYIKQYPDKIKKFEEYNDIDYISGPKYGNEFPKEYCNIGYLPI